MMKMTKRAAMATVAATMALGMMGGTSFAASHGTHAANGKLEVSDAWARARTATAKVAGAFMNIHNMGKEDDRLVSATSDISERVEIHTTKMEKGVMRMLQMKEGIEVKAGNMLELKPGGYHVMFMGLKQKLDEGSEFPVKLQFEKAGAVDIMVKVKASGAMGNMKHGHHGDMKDADKMKHDGMKKMKSN